MKYLILPLFILASCGKKDNVLLTQNSAKTIYYQVSEYKDNGEVNKTEIKYVNISTTNSAVEGDGTGGGQNCPHPVALSINSFNVVLSKNNSINILWSSVNEEGVNHYEIEKSLDSHSWTKIKDVTPNGGIYSYNDSY